MKTILTPVLVGICQSTCSIHLSLRRIVRGGAPLSSDQFRRLRISEIALLSLSGP